LRGAASSSLTVTVIVKLPCAWPAGRIGVLMAVAAEAQDAAASVSVLVSG